MVEPDDSWRTTLDPNTGCGYKDAFRIEIYKDDINLLGSNKGFFLLDIEEIGRNLKITGFSYEILVVNEKCLPEKDFQKDNQNDTVIIDDLITDFSNNISSVFHTGTPTVIPSFRAENQNIGNRLYLISQTTGREWKVVRTGANTYQLQTFVDEVHGTTYGAPNPYTIELIEKAPRSASLKGVKDVVNEVTVLGTGDGIENQVRITMPNERGCTGESDTVNRTCNPPVSGCTGTSGTYKCNHANSVGSQSKFGRITSEPIVDRGITTAEEAIEIGKKALDVKCGYNVNESAFTGWEEITPKVNWVDTVYLTGEWVKVLNKYTGAEKVGRIKEIIYSFSESGETISFKIVNGNVIGDDPINKVKRDSLTGNTSGVGATNMWQISGGYANANNLKPYKSKFYIPEDVKKLNKLIMSIDVDKMRYFSEDTATTPIGLGTRFMEVIIGFKNHYHSGASGSPHTHPIPVGDGHVHEHYLYNHYHDMPNHDHTMQSHTHGMQSHTHAIQSGDTHKHLLYNHYHKFAIAGSQQTNYNRYKFDAKNSAGNTNNIEIYSYAGNDIYTYNIQDTYGAPLENGTVSTSGATAGPSTGSTAGPSTSNTSSKTNYDTETILTTYGAPVASYTLGVTTAGETGSAGGGGGNTDPLVELATTSDTTITFQVPPVMTKAGVTSTYQGAYISVQWLNRYAGTVNVNYYIEKETSPGVWASLDSGTTGDIAVNDIFAKTLFIDSSSVSVDQNVRFMLGAGIHLGDPVNMQVMSIGDHDHTFTVDVYEGVTPTAGGSWALKKNGIATIASGSYGASGNSNIDVMGALTEALPSGWHTLELTPNSGQKQYLNAELYIKCYIESR